MVERDTAQHRAVQRTLGRIEGFISAQDLRDAIVRDGQRISLATAYAHLKRLATSGEVDVVMTDRGETLYRRCAVQVHHHHLSCRRCGATVEIDSPDFEQWLRSIQKNYNYRDLRHVVELNGICPACHAS